MTSSVSGGVPRLTGLSHDAFIQDYIMQLRPAILTDATRHWAALGKWTPEFFRHNFPKLELHIDGRDYRMEDFINLVLASTAERPAPYLTNYLLEKHLPELLPDIFPLPHCTQPNWFESRWFPSRDNYTFVELYIGGTGGKFPVLHYDGWHTHAYLMQLYGVKQYIFFPPEQSHLLYRREGCGRNASSVNDVEAPDLSTFPLFAQATPIRCELHPGETLFAPAGWWHTARILSPSVTVSVNSANAANWRDFVYDYCESIYETQSRLRSSLLKPYLHMFGLVTSLLGTL